MNKQEIEKAIDILSGLISICLDNEYGQLSDAALEISKTYELAISALQQQLTGGWIPVSERLPEDNESVLVYALSKSRGSCVFTIGAISRGYWFTASGSSGIGMLSYPNGDNYDVLAWRPLPEPWKDEAHGS